MVVKRSDLIRLDATIEAERKRTDQLEDQFRTLERTTSSSVSLRRQFLIGCGTTLSGLVLAFGGFYGSALFRDFGTPPCVAQMRDVAEAVKNDMDDPANLSELQRDSCDIPTEAMATGMKR
jgi:hypothetical protein